MEKKKIFILSFLAFLLILFVVVLLVKNKAALNLKQEIFKGPLKESEEDKLLLSLLEKEPLCKDFSNKEEKISCLGQLTGDVSLCEKILEKEIQSNCYIGVAFLSQDISVCDKIQDEEKKGICKFLIKRNSIVCENIFNKEECYKLFAKFLDDKSLCEKIEDKEKLKECLANVDSAIVKEFQKRKEENIQKESSLSDKAVIENNLSLCNTIKNTSIRDNCIYAIARKLQDVSLCEKILEEPTKISCMSILKKDPSLCDNINDNFDVFVKDNCYFAFVTLIRDLSKNLLKITCDKITNIEIKDGCYMQLAIHKEDSSLCSNIQDTVSRKACDTILKKDKNLCKSLLKDNLFYKDYCLYYVAELLKDKTVCEEIENNFMHNKCLKKFQNYE
jgi:hypothetical protein